MSLRFVARIPERRFDVDLEVPTGQTLALLGPNGSGKSTLLAAAAGLLRPSDASISLDGRVLARVEGGATRTWLPPHERHVGLLAQQPRLFPHLSALDNVAFGPRSRGTSRAAARRVAGEWLRRVDLADLGHRRPGQLSGGQAQRVAIARALAADPDLVLLDEPLAALDVDVAPALRQTLRTVLEGRTAVIATHDILDAVLLADAVAVIDEGRIVEHGLTREVLTRPRSPFGARIAGLNLVAGVADGDALRTTGGTLVHGRTAGERVPAGAPVVAIFRPSAVAVYLDAVPGSPRNVFDATVQTLEPYGDLVRVRADGLNADVTPAAVADLGLAPGSRVRLVVKAAEVEICPAAP